MTLGADIAGALPGLRAQAESMMTSTCAITRPSASVWNPSTLQHDTSPVDVYSGKCRLRPAGQQDRGENAADQTFMESRYVLSLPVVGSEDVVLDDTVTVTACPEDPALVGRIFAIVSAPAYSHGTARRFPVRETS